MDILGAITQILVVCVKCARVALVQNLVVVCQDRGLLLRHLVELIEGERVSQGQSCLFFLNVQFLYWL